MYVLDSNALIEFLEDGPRASKVLSVVGDEPLVTTSISMHEVLAGSMSDKSRFILENIFSSMRVLEHDAQAARLSAAIEREQYRMGAKINDADILIAGICKANNAELVTLDSDFTKIKGFKFKFVK
ncbi:MAG TPA: type II toxin-antitoxin system VapC family toxin [Candidatus Nanoarchaeia archaeon]|nr:type II toxin-antitoxin system VapC family toxin [Candidatus Nanoarchaeia archaeon]